MADLSAFAITNQYPAKDPTVLQYYGLPTPNGVKVSIMLEEIGIPYEVHLVDIMKNETWTPDYLSLNPNGKIPAILDPDGPGGKPLPLWESGAILIYLAEKTGKLLPAAGEARARVFEQLFFHASGLGPAFGQAGFFQRAAAEPQPIAIERFSTEARRTLMVLDGALAARPFVAGDSFTIADIAHFGWLWRREFAGVALDDTPHIARWYAQVEDRPAVRRAIAAVEALVPAA